MNRKFNIGDTIEYSIVYWDKPPETFVGKIESFHSLFSNTIYILEDGTRVNEILARKINLKEKRKLNYEQNNNK